MTDQSLAEDLANEIKRAQKWGYNYVTIPRLESMIRKHTVDVPGDISEQPGEWQIRGGYVEAVQHDGTDSRAMELRQWIFDRGGHSKLVRDILTTRILLDSPREPNLVGPSWWIVKTADNIFYTMPDADFHVIYVPREGHDESPS